MFDVKVLDKDAELAVIAKEIEANLVRLDQLGMWQASAYLSMAVAALPGHSAPLPELDHSPSS